MKNLILVSFVGVDEKTNLSDIDNIKSDIPCEWSVLYSDSKSVGNYSRYPSYQFCNDFLDWGASRGWLTSLHLCGSVIERYIKQDQDVMDLCRKAYRIQLNINIKNFTDWEQFSDDLINVIGTHNHHIIMQQNKTKELFNKVFLNKLGSIKTVNVDLLHDGSGGFGREIETTQQPDEKYFTGFAGGIKPENVKKIVNLIENNNPKDKKYYIDMESGIRTDNIFSIEKCRQVIDNLR